MARQRAAPIYIAVQHRRYGVPAGKETAMKRHTALSRIGNIIAIFGSAVAAAHAAEAGRRPRTRDLANLGIEPKAFEAIRRYY